MGSYATKRKFTGGKTPAEKAGIDLQLEGNKCEEMIRRAKWMQSKEKWV
jgi:hypothetical protein